ncbi:ATP-grasp fold amidoligase family protein [Bacillus sp. D386]|uniref:ATP-grasp fold amidoligase family protein n=1 Tax=Bacillus sp. D386 TaxID=2587155 RepID=UPI001122C9D5|nr:ATP-grasp fold amidoligase family protein [Bacillus sp. D386]
MDYKKLIPSQDTRLRILGLTNFIPDEVMIRLQYRIKTGRKLNLKNPQRFTEKLQWYKLYYRKPIMTQCADKYAVRDYIISKGFEDILVPLYGVYERVDEIDFKQLPDKFVIKTTNGSRTNLLCEDKSKLDLEATRELLNNWLIKRTSKAGREWPYYNISPRIICEKFLEKDENNDLVDYKFICFDGKIACVFVNAERYSDDIMRFGIYSRDFEILPYSRKGLKNTDNRIRKPINFEKMVEIAETLSNEFPHVRVDLYNINGKIYFGEMTFFHGSGYIEFDPDEFDFILGEHFQLPFVKDVQPREAL